MNYKLAVEIEKDRQKAQRELTAILTGKPDYADFHAILTNLPSDVELITVHVSEWSDYVFATLFIGNTHKLELRYNLLSKCINVGIGGFLPQELTNLGGDFWRNPTVVRACRIWMEKR